MSSSASSGTDQETAVPVVVEVPKGSRNKYELDHQTGRIRLDRMLYKGPDQKVLVVPLTDPQWNHISGFDQVFGWRDAATGRRVLDDALARGARR
jgi:inorganic pyrophosphatase